MHVIVTAATVVCAFATSTVAIAGFCEDVSAVIADAPSGFAAVRAGERPSADGKSTVYIGKHMLLGDQCYVDPSGSMYRCLVANASPETGKTFLASIEKCDFPRSEKDWTISATLDFGSDASVLNDITMKLVTQDKRIVTAMINTRVATKPAEKAGTYLYLNFRVFRDEPAKR